MSKRRCAIYLYFNARGIFEAYAIEAIKGLGEIAERVLVVVNGTINDGGRQYIYENGFELLVREKKGYDFGGYKDAIETVGYETIKSYDELVFLNSSVYGPVRPLSEVFDEMERPNKKCDFWGITQNKMGFQRHIQSYFFVLKSCILKSAAFKSYWEALPYFATREEAIMEGETKLTKHFANLGFVYGSFIKPDPNFYEDQTIDGAIDILLQGSPFIKRALFNSEEAYKLLLRNGIGNQPFDVINKLDDSWQRIIRDDLIKNSKQSVWSHTLRNIFILNESEYAGGEIDTSKVAAIVFVYFKENVDFILHYVNNLPRGTSIYFVSPKEEILNIYRDKFRNNQEYYIEYRTQQNRGRNETAYWIVCRDVYDKHEYVCLLHDKKERHLEPLKVGRGFFEHQMESLLASEAYIKNIIITMGKNPNIGILQPPVPLQDAWISIQVFSPTQDLNWFSDGEICKLKRELGIALEIDPEMLFPVGGSFWVRSKALSVMLKKNWSIEDFPKEPVPLDFTVLHALERMYPLLVQEAGFCTCVCMSDKYAGAYYFTSFYRLKELYRFQENRLVAFMRKSVSYRIGKAITFIPRKIRDFFRRWVNK